jgi:CRP-like cAMP-binding protein
MAARNLGETDVVTASDNERKLSLEDMQRNAILKGLDSSAMAEVAKSGRLVELATRQQIYQPEQPIKDVYFPLDCVLSIVSNMKDGSQIEIGTIGREGMSAFPLLMGASATANDAYCQVPGSAIKIEATLFRELSATYSGFRQLLDRYLQAYTNMLGQLAACNRLHSIYERCARWLLMTHDRVNRDEIQLTHQYLAMMLGTGRSGVTIAAATLQQAGLIRYAHGTIWILDRSGLEGVACECYDVAHEQFAGLLRTTEQ